MSILERTLYDKFFNNSSYDIATMYLEEAFQFWRGIQEKKDM